MNGYAVAALEIVNPTAVTSHALLANVGGGSVPEFQLTATVFTP